MRTVIYPGTFDPITNGHLDVIERASKLFDRVIVAVAQSDSKQPLFTLEERRDMVEKAVANMKRVEVDSFTCLLISYAEKKGAHAIIRGLRAVSDFEFEFQLALTNRRMNSSIETIFMMPRETFTFLSSRIVKEVCRLGGDVRSFVPAHVNRALQRKFGFAPTRSAPGKPSQRA
ncbi:MAG TPA: pantetheine-phosphate adenylyltransferase [Verrucomicrobiota bacterium]|nr:pantetheine-phosphate adenylyltransferase [Verrucomicrobiota bacterium]